MSLSSPRALATFLLFCFSFFLVCVLIVPVSVHAIGISPPSVQLDYIPGHTYEIPVKLTNYNNFPVGVEVRAEGELASGFTVKKPLMIDAGGALFTTVTLHAPASFERPGYHTSHIFFREVFVDKAQGSFAVRTEVGMRVILWEPYPGSYAEIIASAPSVGEGNDTVLKVLINNLGTEPIANGHAQVRVVSPSGELRDVFTFPNLNIAGNSNQEFFETIPSRSYPPGRYMLESTLIYGENTSRMNGSFIVGTQDIEVLALEGPLYLDAPVSKFRIHVQSLWNLPIENVYGTFQLGSDTADTSPIRLGAFGKDALEGYWETDKTVPPGNQLAHVTVTFTGGTTDALLPITVLNETPAPVDFIVPATEEPSDVVVLTLSDIIFMVLAVVIVVAIVLFGFGKWRKKEGEPPLSDSGGAAAAREAANPVQPAAPKSPVKP